MEPPASAGREAEREDGAAIRSGSGFLVAGIGGSAGALPALQDLFRHMPGDSGIGFVVIVHADPHTPSLLPELLARCTPMRVMEASQGRRVQPNRVYVCPPGRELRIRDGVLSFEPAAPRVRGVRLPIDGFFRSLAEDQQHSAVGVVLSGTGADGTVGLAAIRAASGLALAQDPGTASFGGMPGSAIAAGAVDLVLPTGKMPERLVAHATRLATSDRKPGTATANDGELEGILALVRRVTGRDFSSYKRGTLERRIERRMNLHQIEPLADYLRLLESNPAEVDALWKDWLIGVSHFFRDPDAFRSLAEGWLPRLVAAKQDGAVVRIWVPGCANGEEAYSIAMLLVEAIEAQRKHLEIQIFGTDIDSRAIEAARIGRYPEGVAADVGEERLRRFFVKEERHYRVKKEIRDLIVFAVQDVLTDPPFTRMDLISCRNLLIYLTPAAQKRLLPLFHYSLNPGGLLLLGESESITGFEALFGAFEKRWKFFRRKEVESVGQPGVDWALQTEASPVRDAPAPAAASARLDLADTLRRHLAESYAPPAVIVDERGEIEQIHGRTGPYLEPAPGRANLNLLDMAREGLRAPIAAAIRDVIQDGVTTATRTARVRSDGNLLSVRLAVRRLHDPRLPRPLLLVSFERADGATPRSRKQSAGSGRAQKSRIAEELQITRSDLQSTIEQLQAVNEELASANEEVQSVNEELQSTNEELQTTKEETQSLNEELQTVNAELTAKVHDLEETNDDLLNLINSTDIAMVFLDNRLRVKRFTPAAQRVFPLIGSDVGRPLGDLTSNLDYPELLADAEQALETLAPVQKEVRASDGAWYGVRIRLYRTSRNAIEGLVLILSNLSSLKSAEEAAEQARNLAEAIVDTVREPLLVLDRSLHVIRANRAFYETFAVAAEGTEGRLIYELGNRQWDIPKLRELLENVLPANHAFSDFEVVHEFPGIGSRRMLLNARGVWRAEQDAPDLVLLAIEDASPEPAS